MEILAYRAQVPIDRIVHWDVRETLDIAKSIQITGLRAWVAYHIEYRIKFFEGVFESGVKTMLTGIVGSVTWIANRFFKCKFNHAMWFDMTRKQADSFWLCSVGIVTPFYCIKWTANRIGATEKDLGQWGTRFDPEKTGYLEILSFGRPAFKSQTA